mmetsp:Transcript_9522/g.26689  ORF Transcript_9522/g.26689 Transcript_9522/m.26689 type:complete len:253 (-) Transcript_9522:75-833(-)
MLWQGQGGGGGDPGLHAPDGRRGGGARGPAHQGVLPRASQVPGGREDVPVPRRPAHRPDAGREGAPRGVRVLGERGFHGPRQARAEAEAAQHDRRGHGHHPVLAADSVHPGDREGPDGGAPAPLREPGGGGHSAARRARRPGGPTPQLRSGLHPRPPAAAVEAQLGVHHARNVPGGPVPAGRRHAVRHLRPAGDGGPGVRPESDQDGLPRRPDLRVLRPARGVSLRAPGRRRPGGPCHLPHEGSRVAARADS